MDTIAPQPAIDSLSKTLLKAGETSEVSWHADENAGFQLRVGGADCDSGTILDSGPYSSQPAVHVSNVSAADLQEGANTLRLCLTDAAGNRAQATTSLSKDTQAPQTSITEHPEALASVATAKFEFTGEDPGGSGVASFQCRLDSTEEAAWGACTSPQQYAELSEGSHTFEVRAIDKAGNVDASAASFAWTVDTIAPSTKIDSSPAALISNATAEFQFSGEDPGGSGLNGFQCRLDSSNPGDWASCSSGVQYPGLADGSHTFEVWAIDKAGNADQSAATYTWTVNTNAPETSITANPAALVNTAGAHFESSAKTPAARASPPWSAAWTPRKRPPGQPAPRRRT